MINNEAWDKSLIDTLAIMARSNKSALSTISLVPNDLVPSNRSILSIVVPSLRPGLDDSQRSSEIRLLSFITRLFASNRLSWKDSSFGSSMRALSRRSDEARIERQFMSVLDSDLFGCFDVLSKLMTVAGANKVGLDWLRLVNDFRLISLRNDEVKTSWANDYWGWQ